MTKITKAVVLLITDLFDDAEAEIADQLYLNSSAPFAIRCMDEADIKTMMKGLRKAVLEAIEIGEKKEGDRVRQDQHRRLIEFAKHCDRMRKKDGEKP